MTTRIPNGRNPIRVILDSTLRIPMEANVVTDREAPTWIFTTSNHAEEKKKALENAGVKVFVTSGEKHINLHEMLDVLGQKGVSSLLIEGGGEVNASFIENKLMDKIILYFAPKIIGGRLAPSFVEGTGITKMKDAIEFKDISFTQIGKDYRFIGYPAYRKDEQ
ncbi:riboflavin biosynthesis protein RibD [Streptococcus pneumoniae]|nr:riboflavin biosynthesis protein RibD [Streptococcus pneumoniae]